MGNINIMKIITDYSRLLWCWARIQASDPDPDPGLRYGSGSRPQIRIQASDTDLDPGLRYGSWSRPQIRIRIQASDTDPDPGLTSDVLRLLRINWHPHLIYWSRKKIILSWIMLFGSAILSHLLAKKLKYLLKYSIAKCPANIRIL